MNIQFETTDEVYGVMIITIDEGDYAEQVEKQLKDYRKTAKVDGFRPGAVPLGMIRKKYGTAVKMEIVNKFVSDQLYKYIEDNKLPMLGHALPSARQEPQDLAADSTHTFIFDIALAPAFDVQLSEKDTIDYYNIKVDDALITRQVEMFASRAGSYTTAQEYAANDMVKGTLTERAADGTPLDGGLTIEGAIIMPAYVNDDEQKALFEGTTVGDSIVVNPRKMYGDTELAALLKIDKDEAGKHEGDFTYTISEFSRYQSAPIDQALFDSVYGAGTCADEAAFRQKIAEGLAAQLATDSDYKFLQDLRAHIEQQVGTLTFPDTLLKRIIAENAQEHPADDSEAQYASSLKSLTWHLIKEKLVAQYEIKVDDNDLRATAVEAARVQFAQYGMNNVPEEYLQNYAAEMLKKRESIDGLVDRAIDVKLTQTAKGVVTINNKDITLDEFNKLIEEK